MLMTTEKIARQHAHHINIVYISESVSAVALALALEFAPVAL